MTNFLWFSLLWNSSYYLGILASLEQLINFGELLKECNPDPIFTVQVEEVAFCLANIVQCIEQVHDENIRSTVTGRAMGRPSLVVEEDHLWFYVDHGFRVQDMALMLGCSKRTVERRLHMYNLSTQTYTVISDYQLDDLVLQICLAYPRCGEKLIDGRLRVQGVHVQRLRVRESMRRVDPSGIQARMKMVLRSILQQKNLFMHAIQLKLTQ